MARGTLAWYRCEICGRKATVFECRYNGRTISICPYCITALWGTRGFYCRIPIVGLLGKASSETKWTEADTIISSLDMRLKRSGGRVKKGSSSSRGRVQRR